MRVRVTRLGMMDCKYYSLVRATANSQEQRDRRDVSVPWLVQKRVVFSVRRVQPLRQQ